MSDLREALERERRRFRMSDTSIEDLERRRDARRRNRRIASGLVAFTIAAVGAFAAFAAFRGTGPGPRPAETPSAAAKRVPPPSSQLQFIDANHGWMAVGRQIIATSDGGRTWKSQYSGELTGQADITGLQFIDTRNGWAVSVAGLLKTADGGDTWQHAPASDASWDSVQFLNSRIGWGIQLDLGHGEKPSRIVVATRDGGLSWRHLPSEEVDSTCYLDSQTGFMASGTAFYGTNDGGITWRGVEIPSRGVTWVSSLKCSSASEAWALAVATDGGGAGHVPYALFHTSDGINWDPVLQEGTAAPFEDERVHLSEDPYPGPFDAPSQRTAFLLASCPPCDGTSAITRTIDGGTSWKRFDLPQDVRGEPIGLSFIDEKKGWAAVSGTLPNAQGETSNIFIVKTSDGGDTWEMLGIYRLRGQ